MQDDSQNTSEQVSLLVDGRLQGKDFARAVQQIAASDHARQAWDCDHLIGEVMRLGSSRAQGHDPAFVRRLRLKIARDTPMLIARDEVSMAAGEPDLASPEPANDTWWRRVSGLASVVVMALLVWQVYLFADGRNAPASAPQLAKVAEGTGASIAPIQRVVTSSPAAVADASPALLRDPRLDALLAAHRRFGGTSALQMPSGFLRNATFEEGKP